MRGIGLIVVLALAIALLFAADHYYFSKIRFTEDEVKVLDSAQQKELETFNESRRQIINLAVGIVGGLVVFVLLRYGTAMASADIRILTAGLGLCAFSIYFGYQAIEGTRWMLHSHFFNLANIHIRWPYQAQFWTFILSLGCIALFVYRGLRPLR